MVELTFILRDQALRDWVDQVQRTFAPEGQQAIFEEFARRVSRLVEIPYPQHTYAPLPRIYDWGDGVKHKFKSLAAQRGFFAALGRGKQVPYQRTGALAESLRFKLATSGSLYVLQVIVDSPHEGFDPAWVLGQRHQQSYYFRNLTRWETLEDQMKQPPLYDDIEDAGRIATETIMEDLRL